MSNRRIVFRFHAIQRMFKRRISDDDVKFVLQMGKTVEDYPADKPYYPSRLILGWRNNHPIHVVAADNLDDNETIVITVYEPDPNQWSADFRRRKR